MKVVRKDETIVVFWLFGPTLTMEDTTVEVTTTGGELWLPPDVEEIEFPFPEGPLDYQAKTNWVSLLDLTRRIEGVIPGPKL